MTARSSEARAGVLDILPAMIAAVPIGLIYGVLCQAKGMSVAEVALTSALVFAGGAQFAALELWTQPAPVLALVLSTALINARHLLMGASLAPKIAHWRGPASAPAMFLLTDESWALAERRAAAKRLSLAYWLAMGLALWATWTSVSTLGALLGAGLGDPRALGADFAFTALFIGLIAAFWTGPASGLVIAASAGASALAYLSAGTPWHVLAGAFAGIATAYALGPREGSP